MISRSVAQAACGRRHDIVVTQAGSGLLVRPGDRASVVEYLRNWITNSVEEYLKICDPYFGLEDLEALQWLSL